MQHQRGSDIIKLTWIFRREGCEGLCDEKRRIREREIFKFERKVSQMSHKCHKTIKLRLRKCNLNPQITQDFWHLPSSDTGAGVSDRAHGVRWELEMLSVYIDDMHVCVCLQSS